MRANEKAAEARVASCGLRVTVAAAQPSDSIAQDRSYEPLVANEHVKCASARAEKVYF